MKQRKTARVAGPFSVEALIETHADKTSKILGYDIRGLARIRTGFTLAAKLENQFQLEQCD
jgi:hypothetical protein